jgi:hypothetical protein
VTEATDLFDAFLERVKLVRAGGAPDTLPVALGLTQALLFSAFHRHETGDGPCLLLMEGIAHDLSKPGEKVLARFELPLIEGLALLASVVGQFANMTSDDDPVAAPASAAVH